MTDAEATFWKYRRKESPRSGSAAGNWEAGSGEKSRTIWPWGFLTRPRTPARRFSTPPTLYTGDAARPDRALSEGKSKGALLRRDEARKNAGSLSGPIDGLFFIFSFDVLLVRLRF